MHIVWGWAHQRRRRAECLTGQAPVPFCRPVLPALGSQPHYTRPLGGAVVLS